MTNEQPTPTPYHRSRREWDGGSDTICAKDGRCIAIKPSLIESDDWTTDAEFIVQACNQHKALLNALASLIEAIDSASKVKYDECKWDDLMESPTIDAARKFIEG